MLAQINEDERRELPDGFLGADLSQAAAGEATSNGKGEGNELIGDDRRRCGQQTDERSV